MNENLECDGWSRLAGGSTEGHMSLEPIFRKIKDMQPNKLIILSETHQLPIVPSDFWLKYSREVMQAGPSLALTYCFCRGSLMDQVKQPISRLGQASQIRQNIRLTWIRIQSIHA